MKCYFFSFLIFFRLFTFFYLFSIFLNFITADFFLFNFSYFYNHYINKNNLFFVSYLLSVIKTQIKAFATT